MAPRELTLIIKDRDNIKYTGLVKSVTSFNEKGKFDIISEHANFMTLLSQKLIVEALDGKKQEIFVDDGLLTASENEIKIYLGFKSRRSK